MESLSNIKGFRCQHKGAGLAQRLLPANQLFQSSLVVLPSWDRSAGAVLCLLLTLSNTILHPQKKSWHSEFLEKQKCFYGGISTL